MPSEPPPFNDWSPTKAGDVFKALADKGRELVLPLGDPVPTKKPDTRPKQLDVPDVKPAVPHDQQSKPPVPGAPLADNGVAGSALLPPTKAPSRKRQRAPIVGVTDQPSEDERNAYPYPKDGQVHVRITHADWGVLSELAKSRYLSINGAIAYLAKFYRTYPRDLEVATDLIWEMEENNQLVTLHYQDIIRAIEQIEETRLRQHQLATDNTAPPY